MSEIIIKSASLKNINVLLDFEQGIITAERPFDKTLKLGQISYYDLRQMIFDIDVEVAVAELNGEIIGSGYAKIIEAKNYYTFDRYAYLGFMYTHEDFRGLGVNSKIIEYLKNWCLSKDISEMRLDVYDTNLSAVKAYEKSGFQKDMVNMRIGIKQNQI
jgi:GNAT superfamily N-acetyltransferase